MSERGWITRRGTRLITNLVYREIDVRVDPGFDPGVPTVMVSNHFGGLADGLLLIDALPRMPRIVAKDAIFAVPGLGRAATAAGGIPVHQGTAGRRASNDEMFASCYAALADSEIILIFPEGVTQDVPHIAPVKTGAARIALGARAAGVRGIRVVPVGIHYEDKAGFRQRVLVNIGQPIDVDDWVRSTGTTGSAEDKGAVGAITDQISAQLRHVAPDFPDWATARRYEAAAEVVLRDADEQGAELRYGDVQLLADLLCRRDPDDALGPTAGQYLAALAGARTTEEAVARTTRDRVATGNGQLRARDLLLSVLLLPYALIGAVLGAVPWLIVQALGLLRLSPAMLATLTPAVATFAFGIEWFLVSWWAFNAQGAAMGFATIMLAPVFIAATVFVFERITLLARRYRGGTPPPGPRLARLQSLRQALADQAWAAL